MQAITTSRNGKQCGILPLSRIVNDNQPFLHVVNQSRNGYLNEIIYKHIVHFHT